MLIKMKEKCFFIFWNQSCFNDVNFYYFHLILDCLHQNTPQLTHIYSFHECFLGKIPENYKMLQNLP